MSPVLPERRNSAALIALTLCSSLSNTWFGSLCMTFSTFSFDTALLYERGEISIAVLYVALSVGAALVGLFAGLLSFDTSLEIGGLHALSPVPTSIS